MTDITSADFSATPPGRNGTAEARVSRDLPEGYHEIELDSCHFSQSIEKTETISKTTYAFDGTITTFNPSQFHPTSVSFKLCSDLAKRETLVQGGEVLNALLSKVEIYRTTKGPRASLDEMTYRFQEMMGFAHKVLEAIPEAELVTFYGSSVRGIPTPNDVDVRVLLKPTFLDLTSSSQFFWVRRFSDVANLLISLLPSELAPDSISSARKKFAQSKLPSTIFNKPVEIFFNDQYIKQWTKYFVEPWEVPPGVILLLECGPLVLIGRGKNGSLTTMFSAGSEQFDNCKKMRQKGLFGQLSEIRV